MSDDPFCRPPCASSGMKIVSRSALTEDIEVRVQRTRGSGHSMAVALVIAG